MSNWKSFLGTVLGASALSMGALSTAHATSISYDVVGDINAPIRFGPQGLPIYPDTRFTMNINRGDLVLTYNDKGTADAADDIATLKGTTSGCLGSDCSKSMNNKATQPYGLHLGSGEFDWDITMTEGISNLTKDTGNFAFAMQMNAGTITLKNTTAAYQTQLGAPGDPSADVTLKNDNTPFAFQIVTDANGNLVGTGWLALMGGFLGQAGVRYELGPNNNNVNWAFQLFERGGNPPPPPPGNEVPEPATAALLGAGALGIARKRKKLAAA